MRTTSSTGSHPHRAAARAAGARGADDPDEIGRVEVEGEDVEPELREEVHPELAAPVDLDPARPRLIGPHLCHGHSTHPERLESLHDVRDTVGRRRTAVTSFTGPQLRSFPAGVRFPGFLRGRCRCRRHRHRFGRRSHRRLRRIRLLVVDR
ncbi:hypothetical protein ACRAWF_03340 [Streptomyces sp. L7]